MSVCLSWCRCLIALMTVGFPHHLLAQSNQGKEIYLQKCASCHGKQGQGVEKVYPEPLTGDLSIKELAKYISEAMPEKKPETCVGKEAEQVASHIHNQFYSVTAQARIKPAHIAFSRLTNRQYRNSIADLAGSFSWEQDQDEQRGILAVYYKNRRENKQNIAIERVEPTVNLSYEPGQKPDDEIEFESFTAKWNGGLFVPETGQYEFVVKTDNAIQFYLNDHEKPLIDAQVQSGDKTEHRISLFLLGGRSYPIRINLYKSKPEKKISLQLRWKPPYQAEEVIPSRFLSPKFFPEVIVVETPFPPDDKSVGYERGVSVSKQWNDATTFAAVEVADKILSRIESLAKVKSRNAKQQKDKLQKFCETFAARAFRRPLTDQLKSQYIDRQFAQVDDPLIATRRVILMVLKSPRFLFLGITDNKNREQADQYRVAEWLAFAIWDSIPDQRLLDLAAKGKLKTESQIRSEAERMVQNYRTRSKVRAFFHQWLQYDHFYDLTKSKELYPEFDEQFASDLRQSLDLLIEDVFWSDDSDYRELLSTNSIYFNGRLAGFYGVNLPADADFQRVSFKPNKRAGLISHPYLMAGLAYEQGSSPIHRGVFLARSLVGRFLKPPPVAIAPLEVDLNPDMTTRERVALQTKGAVCGSCHGLINQLGFTLENFDAAGRFREQDNGKKIDTSGQYIDRVGKTTAFQNAKELTEFLMHSPESHTAFTEQLFQYLTKQPAQAFGPGMLDQLRSSFEKQEMNMQKLLAEIAVQSAIKNRERSSR